MTLRLMTPRLMSPRLMNPRLSALFVALALLAGCHEEPQTAVPPPREIGDAAGHFCGMPLAEHPGPKGQVFLRGDPAHPVWFTSARDAVAFTLLPEEPKDIVVLYVTDMGRTADWNHPEAGAWVDARQAWFVIGSRRAGGMGAAEAVPFSSPEAARAFVAANGGQSVRLAEIPPDYVLGGEPGSRSAGGFMP